MARPLPGHRHDGLPVVRAFAEELVEKRWAEKGPRWDVEVVATAAALAINDAATTRKLHPPIRTALDRIWTVQRADGVFDWLKCGWPPMEDDDEYGAVLAAIAVGPAGELSITAAGRGGNRQPADILRETKRPTLHHLAMLVWAFGRPAGTPTPEDRERTLADLSTRQLLDGGWSASSLGDWRLRRRQPCRRRTSPTVGDRLRPVRPVEGGVPATDSRIVNGIAWLKTH